LHRIVSQSLSVVAVFITAGDTKHALTHQFTEAVNHLARLPAIAHARRYRFSQFPTIVSGLEQHRYAIGTTVRMVKASDHRFTEKTLEYNRLCCDIVSR